MRHKTEKFYFLFSSFGPSRYQYSVLNTRLGDPDDDSGDPLMNDIERSEEDGDNFLDISRYQYSDEDDVELLGVNMLNVFCQALEQSPKS